MPIAYSIDRENGCVVETWTGDVTARDLTAHWRRYLADPEVLALRRTLVDLRHCRIMFTAAELSQLVERIVLPALHGMNWRTAIVLGRYEPLRDVAPVSRRRGELQPGLGVQHSRGGTRVASLAATADE